MTNDNTENQISRAVYHAMLSIMKFTLDLEEQKYLEKGRNDERYKFFKKQLMAHTYENTRSLFKKLEFIGLVERIEDEEEDVKDGYKPTISGGSGYINTDRLNAWLEIE